MAAFLSRPEVVAVLLGAILGIVVFILSDRSQIQIVKRTEQPPPADGWDLHAPYEPRSFSAPAAKGFGERRASR
jgi:hypothetical protein